MAATCWRGTRAPFPPSTGTTGECARERGPASGTGRHRDVPRLRSGLDEEEGLTVLDGLGVLDQNLVDASADLGFDLVHELHRFDDAEDLSFLDGISLSDERVRAGGGGG